jgi:ankyrin repeat protein
VNNKRVVLSVASFLGIAAISGIWFLAGKNSHSRSLTDQALLSLIKNDLKGFETFIDAGGDLHDTLPMIDGNSYTVAQGISYFSRPNFAKYLHDKKISYVKQDETGLFDIMTLSIAKNNPELLEQLSFENPDFSMAYGKKGWNLLHMASANCAHKLTSILHEKGKLNWDTQAKDGSTPLTLAAENECIPMLSYWKDQGADFRFKDGTGHTALSILKTKKDAALMAFAASFEEKRKTASVTPVKKVPDFYKKRKIPKDQMIDYSSMIEPEDRPLEAIETAEFSEFAD